MARTPAPIAAALTALLCGLFAAAATATQLTGLAPARLALYQRWVDRSLVPTTHERIYVRLTGCPGSSAVEACTSSLDPSVYLYPDATRFVLMHELGHRFDYRMPASTRNAFRALMSNTHRWWSPDGLGEQFADAYAVCAVYGAAVPSGFKSVVGYAPTPARQRAACRLIRQTARAHRPAYDFSSR